MPRALLISGGGGAGKTTIAQALGRLLTADHHPTAVLDLDAVAQFGPAGPAGRVGAGIPAVRGGPAGQSGPVGPAGPPSGRPVVGHLRFHDQLKVQNLAAVWTTYRHAGARFMVVSGHVETPELRAAYTSALAECDVQMVRLDTSEELIAERTRTTRGPGWDLQAALAQAAEHQPIQDFTVRNDRTVEQVAAEVAAAVGWSA